MRRNQHGGHRGGQVWQSSPRISEGPLITDLGLQDIDKELELLQRKREIIEQQQKILSNEFRGRNNYEESYSQSSRYEPSSFNDRRDYSAPNRKRSIPVWEDEVVPSKRFSGPVRSRSRPFAQPAPPPLMRTPIHYPSQPRRPPPKTAKAPAPSPSKPRSSTPKKDAVQKTDPSLKENWLLPEREPNKQVRGRLELALGCIIKEMRADSDSSRLKAPSILRDIKTVIRDRIREVMMDSAVGTSDSIIARYREVYDKGTDADLIANATRAQTGDVSPFKLEDPDKFFRVNLQRLMHLKLKRIFDQIELIVRNQYPEEKQDEPEVNDIILALNTSSETNEAAEKVMKEIEEDLEKNPLDENIVSTETYKILDKCMALKMTDMIKRFLPVFLRLMDMDSKYKRLKNTITEQTAKMMLVLSGHKINDNEGNKVNVQPINSLRATYKPLPYYAKVMGKPGLPRRNQMEPFFELYQPKSIKKHRTVHNLLFVGFNNKESFEKFLAANGTVIGKYTLNIKISERTQPELDKNELNTSTASEDKLIGSELDEQITDLLTSIRNSEDDDKTGIKTEEKDAKDAAANSDNGSADNNIAVDAEIVKAEDAEVEMAGNVDIEKTQNVDVETAENADVEITGNSDIEIAGNTDVDTADNPEENLLDDVNTGNADANTANGDANTPETADADSKRTENESAEPAGTTEDTEQVREENNGIEEQEKADLVKPLEDKPTGRSTPVRASSRLAGTPSRIQTRRASRLAQNDA